MNMNAYSIWYRRTDYWNVKSLIQKRDTCHSESILSNQMSKLNDLCFNQRFSICTITLSKRVWNRYLGTGSGKSETLGEYSILVSRTVLENSEHLSVRLVYYESMNLAEFQMLKDFKFCTLRSIFEPMNFCKFYGMLVEILNKQGS